jgi:rhamnulokinase
MKHIAVDLGASSGKIFVGGLEKGLFKIEEVHRFDDYLLKEDGSLIWDIEKIEREIYKGINKAVEKYESIKSLGIDSRGVDFVLLDKDDKILGKATSYRDERTLKVVDEVKDLIGDYELYEKTGIQYQAFNTIYQLYYLKKYEPEILDQAETFLMLPDYINFLLTGKKYNEYTNASTSQLLDPKTGDRNYSLIKSLGLPEKIFKEILQPATLIGPIKENENLKLKNKIDLIAVASHDTASAVATVKEEEDRLFLSSGTWSLLGSVIDKPIINKEAFQENYTNEGAINKKIRFLKNITGMRIVQRLRQDLEEKYSFAKLDAFSLESSEDKTIDLNDPVFLSPKSMKDTMLAVLERDYGKGDYQVKDLVKIFYNSLLALYKDSVHVLDGICGVDHKKLQIIGGGSQAKVLDQKIKDELGLDIYLGPIEGSAIGNLMVQMTATEYVTIEDLREILFESGLIERI